MVVMRALLSLCAATFALAAAAAPASAEVRPGNVTETAGASCTSNFLFTGGGKTYLGQAAHCSGTGAATDTNGCDSGVRPIGTPVTIQGAQQPGRLAYNSWNTMQAVGEKDPNACDFNDFALVELSPADAAAAKSSVPVFGGPVGLGAASPGQQAVSYQNSRLRGGIGVLSPKNALVLSRGGDGWNYTVYTLTPGIPGDSGSGYMTSTGRAFGVLSTVAVAPLAGSNGVTDLGKALEYARAHGFGVSLVNGTDPFRVKLLGLL